MYLKLTFADFNLTIEAMTKKKPRPRKMTFDALDPEMKKLIQDLATELDVPPGDVMNMFTLEGIESLDAGNIDPSSLLDRGNHPRYKNRLDLSSLLKRFRGRRRR